MLKSGIVGPTAALKAHNAALKARNAVELRFCLRAITSAML